MQTVIITIAAIIALPFIIALFVPKEYGEERSIVINAPKHEVFDYIKYIKNQDYYSKWVMIDPHMQKTFTGTDGTVGFVYAWNGNNKAGEGEHEITGIADGERLNSEVRFVRPFKNVGHLYMVTEPLTEHSTKVTWGMTGKSGYPLNLMTSLIKGGLGKDLDVSLNNLKRLLEK